MGQDDNPTGGDDRDTDDDRAHDDEPSVPLLQSKEADVVIVSGDDRIDTLAAEMDPGKECEAAAAAREENKGKIQNWRQVRAVEYRYDNICCFICYVLRKFLPTDRFLPEDLR